MKRELLNYDIFPKVFPTDTCVRFTVKPLGGMRRLKPVRSIPSPFMRWTRAILQDIRNGTI